jgi:hypothetical protein
MTLPFRRRHHDDESSHDRARSLASNALIEPLDEPDAAWLGSHLERCPECRVEQAGFAADRALLRALRETEPTPPRDLWARTSAAIEAQARPGHARAAGLGGLGRSILGPTRRGIPIGPLSGALVAIVVLAVAFQSQGIPQTPGQSHAATDVAVGSPPPGPTAFPVPSAAQVAWVEPNGHGQFSIVIAPLDEACPPAESDCVALEGGTTTKVTLGAPPQAVVLSPGSDQAAVVGAAGEASGSVIIVALPTHSPSTTPGPTSGTSTPPATPTAPSIAPTVTPAASGSFAPPGSGHAIVHGVRVVGDIGYSADGAWLAFSARPLVGDRGPDLYIWHTGDDQATKLTDDGRTFFSGWFRNQIVASGIAYRVDNLAATATPAVEATESPSTEPAPTEPTSSEPANASVPPANVEEHPFSFLLDPSTGVRTDFPFIDVWLPSIDPTGRFVTYWSGTVLPDPSTGGPTPLGGPAAWRPATGHLVLDGWSAPLAASEPGASGSANAASPDASAAASSEGTPESSGDVTPGPSASLAPVAVGPAGTPIELAAGPLTDFDAHFDPSGTRLAVWVGNAADAAIGHLRLLVLDAASGTIDPTIDPLGTPGVMALRGFSIENGRLGWVSPPGQDGQPSSVQVLAWSGDTFGQIQSAPGLDPQIIR